MSLVEPELCIVHLLSHEFWKCSLSAAPALPFPKPVCCGTCVWDSGQKSLYSLCVSVFTVDTHMTTNRFSHNSTFSFISFGVLCSPVILTSCSLTVRWCGYATCAENNKKSSPSQGPGSTAAQGAPCPRVWVTLTAATKRLLRKRRPNFRKPHCCTRGLQGTAAELQDSRARRPSTTTPVWSPTTLWATGECRWYGWMCFLVLKHLRLK